jgi:hypothetical protein
MGNEQSIQQGQQALHYFRDGRCELKTGPRLVKLKKYERLENLNLYNANQHQYLVVMRKDGLVEHFPGFVRFATRSLSTVCRRTSAETIRSCY